MGMPDLLNRDEIIRMAREACAKACESDDWRVAATIVRARREQWVSK